MLKRVFKKTSYLKFLDNYPSLNPGSLTVAIFCVFLIVISTFTQVPVGTLVIPNGFVFNISEFVKSLNQIISAYFYIPQIPAVLFTGALLGPGIGAAVVLIYLIIGLLGFPIFAAGGGINYYTEPGFGYILGYFLGIYFLGTILSKKITTLSITLSTIISVLFIHITGILYLTLLMLFQHSSIPDTIGMIWSFSGAKLPYDFVISIIAVSLARPLRSILWVIME